MTNMQMFISLYSTSSACISNITDITGQKECWAKGGGILFSKMPVHISECHCSGPSRGRARWKKQGSIQKSGSCAKVRGSHGLWSQTKVMVGADLTDFLGYVLLCGEGGCITHTEKRAQIIRIQLDERTPDTENAVTFSKVSWTGALALHVWSPDQQHGGGAQVIPMHTSV